MVVTKHIAEHDIVELTETVEGAGRGRGGVLDIFADGKAMVEITSLPGELDIDHILVVSVEKLRVIEPAQRSWGRLGFVGSSAEL